MNPIDVLLDWKYEIAKVLCTQKLETLNNEELVNKFGYLDFENNKSELMKALQNLKVTEETQKIILDDFVKQKGFESLNLEPFEKIEKECGIQVNNRDVEKTIFLPMQNDFIKLCKVIWRIIKNTKTKHNWTLARNIYNYDHLRVHINCVFKSNANKAFFDALHSFNDAWDKKLIIDKFKTDKFESEKDEQESFIYQQENDIYAYFDNLSRIKCTDAEYTEFANRLDLPCLDRKVVISANFERIYAADMYVGRKCNSHPNNENTMQQPIIGIPERRETCGSKIKRFALDLLNSFGKKWDSLPHKTKKIILISLFLVFFVLWTLALLNISETAVFMSLALSWTIAIISFIGTTVFGGIFVLLIMDDPEDMKRNLSNRRNSTEIQFDPTGRLNNKSKGNDIDLNLDKIKPGNSL